MSWSPHCRTHTLRSAMRIILDALTIGLSAFCHASCVSGGDIKDQYDFIVVGAGASGAVVASRLARISPSRTVLVVETGKDESSNPILAPSYFFRDSKFTHIYRHYFSQEGPNVDNRRLYHMSPKALGGGTAVNAMVWTWGDRRDWDLWTEKSGLEGWTYEDMKPYLQQLETYEYPDPSGVRGRDGNVHVSMYKPNDVTLQAINSASGVFDIPVVADNNAGLHEAVSVLQRNMRGDNPVTAQRQGSWLSFLLRANESLDNLEVVTSATVTKVMLEDHPGLGGAKVATGVKVLVEGDCIEVSARKEVILSTGAHNTPKVLMLSGIGNATELREVGVTPLVDLPAVGKNMLDHINPGSLIFFSDPRDDYDGNLVGAYGRTSVGATDVTPDVEFGYIMGPAQEDREAWPHVPAIVMFYCLMLNHDALGSIRLFDNDPLSDPLIESGYFKTVADQRRVVEIFRLLFKWASVMHEVIPMTQATGGPYPLRVDPDSSDEDILGQVKHTVDTHWHVAGTCRMGHASDPAAVTDGKMRVQGVERLRVVDASVMPNLPNGHPMAVLMALGLRAADWIAEDDQAEGG